jgi:hypothetical protein
VLFEQFYPLGGGLHADVEQEYEGEHGAMSRCVRHDLPGVMSEEAGFVSIEKITAVRKSMRNGLIQSLRHESVQGHPVL